MDINPTLSTWPISTSILPAAGKRRRLANNLQIIRHAADLPASNLSKRHHTTLRILSQEIKNVCLHALMTDFPSWWDNVPQAGSKQSRLEHLLFQFDRQEIGDLMAYQLREVLLLNGINVSATAASDALVKIGIDVISTTLSTLLHVLRVEITDEQQTQVKALWQTLDSEDCIISQLIALMNMPEYQQLEWA